jgi:hypothetical protein
MRVASLLALAAIAMSATGAQAQEWCGYHGTSIIECGYSTAEQCSSAVGKTGMCFIDPDEASVPARGRIGALRHS